MSTLEYPTAKEIEHILKESQTIAVVGLSENPSRTSYQVSKVMQNFGYKIIPVNPKADEVLGEKAVSSLLDIDEEVDIINVFRRQEHLPAIAEEAAKTDADVFWTQLDLENEEAYHIAKEAGLTVVMDKCIKVEREKLQ
ncbi:Predicted CoA-binding protein [Alteribacillus persepolensis]|uniref:Predicted CoA-binding protein n=1 Tax=Alteribacillus persepolensis TaxID=568899 RepID=A0A1G7Z1C0_9BACI|nr:CoA-binding protein [Alteribacillus persepolensis]SDH02493.1 Predicted CoA-binding protein [Alteribacillus persepolensis]